MILKFWKTLLVLKARETASIFATGIFVKYTTYEVWLMRKAKVAIADIAINNSDCKITELKRFENIKGGQFDPFSIFNKDLNRKDFYTPIDRNNLLRIEPGINDFNSLEATTYIEGRGLVRVESYRPFSWW